ncbi:hypothetical protein Tco_1558421 [Tanacetum coccineum]
MDSNVEQVSRENVNEELPCLGTNSGDAFKLPSFATKKSKIAIGPVSLSVIATKLGTQLMSDSYSSAMCLES